MKPKTKKPPQQHVKGYIATIEGPGMFGLIGEFEITGEIRPGETAALLELLGPGLTVGGPLKALEAKAKRRGKR